MYAQLTVFNLAINVSPTQLGHKVDNNEASITVILPNPAALRRSGQRRTANRHRVQRPRMAGGQAKRAPAANGHVAVQDRLQWWHVECRDDSAPVALTDAAHRLHGRTECPHNIPSHNTISSTVCAGLQPTELSGHPNMAFYIACLWPKLFHRIVSYFGRKQCVRRF